MFYSNFVSISGVLITEPQTRTKPGGGRVSNARIIVVKKFLINQGNAVGEHVSTFNLAFHGDYLVQIAEKLHSNDNIHVEGELETRSTVKQEEAELGKAQTRMTTEIIVRNCAIVTDPSPDKEPA